jgi:transcriptional regulator with XRE-family HTH domain
VQLNELSRGAISAELTRQGLSQRALARKLGWSQQYLWRRLAGTFPLSTTDLEDVAAALGVPVTKLLPTTEPAA